jgi:hypothetical protein
MSPRSCQARCHMSPAQFGVWTYASQVSYGSGIFYGDVRATAEQFSSTGKSVIHRIVKSLEVAGWLRVIRPTLRENDGTFSCAQYRVVSHAEWVHDHPGQCVACPVRGTGCDEPANASTCPKTDPHLSRTWDKVLEKKVLKREEAETERASTQTVLAPQAGEIENRDEDLSSIFEQPAFGALLTKTKFEPSRASLQEERNRQIRLLQEWKAVNRK